MVQIFGRKKVQPDFTIDAQKELGYHIKSSEMLKQILQAKQAINTVKAEYEIRTAWVIINATKAITYRKLIGDSLLTIIQTNALVHQWVLPFIQPEKTDKKSKAVRGYTKIYTRAKNETLSLLQDLGQKHLIQQKTLSFQRILKNNAVYFTLAEFLNGISPDRDFVIPTKDRTYVLPAINNPYGNKGVNMNDILDKL